MSEEQNITSVETSKKINKIPIKDYETIGHLSEDKRLHAIKSSIIIWLKKHNKNRTSIIKEENIIIGKNISFEKTIFENGSFSVKKINDIVKGFEYKCSCGRKEHFVFH